MGMPLRLSPGRNCSRSKFNCVLYDFYIHVTWSQAKPTQVEAQRLKISTGWVSFRRCVQKAQTIYVVSLQHVIFGAG